MWGPLISSLHYCVGSWPMSPRPAHSALTFRYTEEIAATTFSKLKTFWYLISTLVIKLGFQGCCEARHTLKTLLTSGQYTILFHDLCKRLAWQLKALLVWIPFSGVDDFVNTQLPWDSQVGFQYLRHHDTFSHIQTWITHWFKGDVHAIYQNLESLLYACCCTPSYP